MYAGSPYAGAPYAGSAASVDATPDLSTAAVVLVIGDGVYVEADFVAPLPEVNAHNYVVALAYPTWTRPGLVLGPPVYPAADLYPATDLYPQGA